METSEEIARSCEFALREQGCIHGFLYFLCFDHWIHVRLSFYSLSLVNPNWACNPRRILSSLMTHCVSLNLFMLSLIVDHSIFRSIVWYMIFIELIEKLFYNLDLAWIEKLVCNSRDRRTWVSCIRFPNREFLRVNAILTKVIEERSLLIYVRVRHWWFREEC